MEYRPGYLKLLDQGILADRVKRVREHLLNCRLCPHRCGVNRIERKGICQAGHRAKVASFGPHLGEERVLVGSRGSGTVFFAHCNMRCAFCQNYQLSIYGQGNLVSNHRLAEIFLNLQDHYNCHNINLVTPSHFLANIIEAIYLAAKHGLRIPIVYNCGGYESLEALKLLDGIVDIYMPDLKYSDEKLGRLYSGIVDYPRHAKAAVLEMDRQLGGLEIDRDGLVHRGLLIRHLVLPNNIENSKGVLRFISEELSSQVLVNLMDQYYPAYRAWDYDKIDKGLGHRDYRKLCDYARDLKIRLV